MGTEQSIIGATSGCMFWTVTFGAAFLRGLCLAQPFLCIDFTSVGVIQSYGLAYSRLVAEVILSAVAVVMLRSPLPGVSTGIFPLHCWAFRWMWLTIVLSFGFNIPVVLWADAIPIIGMLMIPKTCAYVWTVLIGYSAMQNENK